MRSRKTILLLHLAGQYPLAGVLWQAVHHLVGLRQLGHDVYYVEDSAAPPYDPRVRSVVSSPAYNVSCLQQALERFGFADRWAYCDPYRDVYYGLSRMQLQALYRRADIILNLCGASLLRAEHRDARLVYIETDPVFEQIRVAQGHPQTVDFLRGHDVCFTYGENLGAADCPIPLSGCEWRKTRPPVVLDLWEPRVDATCRYFTTVATWHNKGKDVSFQGKTYQWSKHVNFLKFLDLPSRVSQPLELAVETLSDGARAKLVALGWHVTAAAECSATVERYRNYIYASRGEFTVAKDIYVQPRSGWFSDRSVCYLAAGKPVVTQDTGFSKFIPTGEGLFAFANVDDVVAALETINTDYARHARAARAIAAEYFAAEKVLRKLLADAGL